MTLRELSVKLARPGVTRSYRPAVLAENQIAKRRARITETGGGAEAVSRDPIRGATREDERRRHSSQPRHTLDKPMRYLNFSNSRKSTQFLKYVSVKNRKNVAAPKFAYSRRN
ncbi:MAG: hypothetical protein AAGL24_18935 [Pseudomonadota bacterium]